MAVQIVLAACRRDLWTDEFITMSAAYRAARNVVTWLGALSSAYDPHFPTLYVVTRLVSGVLYGQPIEVFVRLPAVLLTLAALALAVHWAVTDRRGAGPLLGLALLGALVLDPEWRAHSAEARMYGLMAALGVAIVAAVACGRYMAAAWLGLALVLLHPFGAIVGFVPAAVTLAGPYVGLDGLRGRRRARVWLLVASLGVFAVAAGWSFVKFIAAKSHGFSVQGGSDAAFAALAALNPVAAGAAGLAVLGASVGWRRRARSDAAHVESVASLATYGAILVALAGAVALFVTLKPGVRPYPRYWDWLNPMLFAICAALVVPAVARLRGTIWPSATGACAALVMVVTLAVRFGPEHGTGLRDAAAYLNATVDERAAVASDSFEMFFYPAAYRAGFACWRGGQVVAYLSERVRARMPCQDEAGRVGFAPDVARVFVVREPGAWIGDRRLMLDDFTMADKVVFGRAVVEIYDRKQ